jgi:methionyl aminopeptidase
VIEAGDLVTCDVTAEKDGYMADAAVTVGAGATDAASLALIACARRAFSRGAAAARPGATVRDIGRAVEREATRGGFAVVRALTGHGIGHTIHEEPMVPNFDDPDARVRLIEGLVITVEPLLAMGSGDAVEDNDGWTVRTMDRSLSAHHEETIVVTRGGPVILTAA